MKSAKTISVTPKKKANFLTAPLVRKIMLPAQWLTRETAAKSNANLTLQKL